MQMAPLLGIFLPQDKSIPDVFIPMPSEVKALYVTAPVALTSSWLDKIANVADTTEINSLVINVKDGDSLYLNKAMADTVRALKQKGIYPIARIVVFQDNDLVKKRPDLALKTKAGQIWSDKSYHWVDPSSKEVWDYNLDIADKALDMGFEEINFDYFRFPSDGSLNKIVYPFYDGITPRQEIIAKAAEYLTSRIRQNKPEAKISLDIFGYTFLKNDDLGIGQKLSLLAGYFDAIAPMVYPSHFSAGNFGFQNPAAHPYEVILETLKKGQEEISKSGIEQNFAIRPWIQDFDMGAIYDAKMVRQEIQAISDAGLHSGWMVWNPSNTYDKTKFLPK